MKQSTLLPLLFLVFFQQASAQNTATAPPDSVRLPTVFQFLFQEQVLNVTLELDFEKLLRNKENNTFQPAKFSYVDKTGAAQETAVEVRPKGHSRRKICDIPPLKVKFPEAFLTANGLQQPQTLEMVVICKNDPAYEEYVLREYAAYRLYNILTDRSLRVQLLQLKFKEPGAKLASAEGFAFFIEPEAELAQRLNAKVVAPRRISPKGLQANAFDLFSLFQFMIGNTDWYVYNRHNLLTLAIQGDSLFTAVPYDFDYSGFVHCPYAVPPTRLQLRNTTTRYFLGLCRPPSDWAPTLQLFREHKAELLGFCQQFGHFNQASKQYTTGYLEDFFELLDNPQMVQEKIVEHCGAAFIK